MYSESGEDYKMGTIKVLGVVVSDNSPFPVIPTDKRIRYNPVC